MNTHFCKVGKTSTIPGKVLKALKLEKAYVNQIEEAYNVKQTDASLSDVLYHEAKKLKQQLLSLKSNSGDLDAAF